MDEVHSLKKGQPVNKSTLTKSTFPYREKSAVFKKINCVKKVYWSGLIKKTFVEMHLGTYNKIKSF